MKNLKISAKLIICFSLVSLLTIIVGIVGAIGLKNNNDSYSEAIARTNTVASALSDMREQFQMQRLAIRTMIIDMTDPIKLQSTIDEMTATEAAMENAMKTYESAITDKNLETNYYKAKDAYYNEYAEIKQIFIAASKVGDQKTATQAMTEGAKAAQPIAEGLKATIAYNAERIEDTSRELGSNSYMIIALQIAVMLLAAVFSMILGTYLSKVICRPIKTMSDFFVRFGTYGDLELTDEDVTNIKLKSGDKDEIGNCINAASKLVDRIIEINQKLNQVAKQDLTAVVKPLSDKDSLGLAFSAMMQNLNAMFAEIRNASEQVSTGAGQIAQSAQLLASGSTEQAANIEDFSNSLSALQKKTQINAENSMRVQEKNAEVGHVLNQSISSMGEMLKAMNEIDESSNSITKIIKVIDDIAFQTNILALNAAVEAARAGQHGKGFAVVAGEVRNLASKSAEAAKETAALIDGSNQKVLEGNQIVKKTNDSLETVAASAKETIQLLEDVTTASAEQANAINEMNRNIIQISSVIQANSASAEQSSAAAEEMSSQSIALNSIVSGFKLRNSSEHKSFVNKTLHETKY